MNRISLMLILFAITSYVPWERSGWDYQTKSISINSDGDSLSISPSDSDTFDFTASGPININNNLIVDSTSITTNGTIDAHEIKADKMFSDTLIINGYYDKLRLFSADTSNGNDIFNVSVGDTVMDEIGTYYYISNLAMSNTSLLLESYYEFDNGMLTHYFTKSGISYNSSNEEYLTLYSINKSLTLSNEDKFITRITPYKTLMYRYSHDLLNLPDTLNIEPKSEYWYVNSNDEIRMSYTRFDKFSVASNDTINKIYKDGNYLKLITTDNDTFVINNAEYIVENKCDTIVITDYWVSSATAAHSVNSSSITRDLNLGTAGQYLSSFIFKDLFGDNVYKIYIDSLKVLFKHGGLDTLDTLCIRIDTLGTFNEKIWYTYKTEYIAEVLPAHQFDTVTFYDFEIKHPQKYTLTGWRISTHAGGYFYLKNAIIWYKAYYKIR